MVLIMVIGNILQNVAYTINYIFCVTSVEVQHKVALRQSFSV